MKIRSQERYGLQHVHWRPPGKVESYLRLSPRSISGHRSTLLFHINKRASRICERVKRGGHCEEVHTCLPCSGIPVDRATSEFYCQKRATWEKQFDPTKAAQTLQEYLKYDAPVKANWMTWTLAGKSIRSLCACSRIKDAPCRTPRERALINTRVGDGRN